MTSENTKYLVRSKDAAPELVASSKPNDLGPNEVLIRLRAVAVNPADVKMIDQGHRVQSYPFVAGLDGAGVVDAIGDAVKNVSVGDEVIGTFMTSDRSGSFQNFAALDEKKVARKPDSWTWEEAASLGVCYATAVAALGIGLKIALPFIPGGPTSSFKPKSVLVLGGSSALGAATIQLLRLALPEARVFATSSPKHHEHIEHLGADKAFDRSSASLVEEIKVATLNSKGVDAIVDTVGAGTLGIFNAFNSSGTKRYAQVWTGEDEIEVPEDVESNLFRSRDLSQMQGGENVMLSLQRLLEEGRYTLPLPVKRIEGKGLKGLDEGLAAVRKGVSGEKVVVTI